MWTLSQVGHIEEEEHSKQIKKKKIITTVCYLRRLEGKRASRVKFCRGCDRPSTKMTAIKFFPCYMQSPLLQ